MPPNLQAGINALKKERTGSVGTDVKVVRMPEYAETLKQ
jgi:hypothetical protein